MKSSRSTKTHNHAHKIIWLNFIVASQLSVAIRVHCLGVIGPRFKIKQYDIHNERRG